MLDVALSIDAAADNSVNSASSAFPEHPDANATKLQLVAWTSKFQNDLTNAGFGCMLRKEPPRETLKLVDRALLTVPSDQALRTQIEMKNEDIRHQNAINEAERISIVNEYKTRMAAKIDKSLRPMVRH